MSDLHQQISCIGRIERVPVEEIGNVKCVLLEDVQRIFPGATSVMLEGCHLHFIRDKNGNKLNPPRMKAHIESTLSVFIPTENEEIRSLNKRLENIDLIPLVYDNTLTIIQRAEAIFRQNY